MKYIIKKGKHFAKLTWSRLFPFVGKKVEGSVIFSEECLVQGEISGWNKLTGISSLNNHNNSGRLVWMSNGEKIRIAGYVYKDGVRNEREIMQVVPERIYSYSIRYSEGYWIFTIDHKQITMTGKLGFWKFRQFPFFGGQSTAPVTMELWLN
jgi:hypothetical protein